jgi:threonine synthase
VSVKKAIRTLQRYDGIVEQATEQELADAAAEADRTGMFNCPHTGVALAVLKKLVARGEIGARQQVVVISTANGLKFTDFKIGYHDRALPGIESHVANAPVVLPNDYDAVVRAIERHRDARDRRRSRMSRSGSALPFSAPRDPCARHRAS